jgi:hypothetical protein
MSYSLGDTVKTSNLANESLRVAETGMVWEERLSGSAGTLQLMPYQTFRVRAAAGGTVTIDGVLAATMISGEIMIFNAGPGLPVATTAIPGVVTKQAVQVTVAITGAQFVQVARDAGRRI